MFRAISGIIGLILFFPLTGFSYELYVHSTKAPVYQMPDSGAEKIVTLSKGARISGIKKKGYWHQVDYMGKNGWIYNFMVRNTPPVDKQDIYGQSKSLSKKYELFSKKARRRPSSYTAVAAARGLKEKRNRFSGKYHLDFESLEKIENIDISESDIRQFIAQGMANDKN